MFIPPMNLGQFQPSPATMSQWIYQIWQFLQENPIATETEIREFIQSELTQSETLGNAIEEYLTENPPPAPVQSVQGKTGAVQLAYNEIVPASNAVPVYKASSTPSASTLQGQYNNGYRLFVNTATQEIFTISPAGALSLVGRGKFDGTTIDLDTEQGDTTIYESIQEIINNTTLVEADSPRFYIDSGHTSQLEINNQNFYRVGRLVLFALVLHVLDDSILPVFDQTMHEYTSVEYINYARLNNMPIISVCSASPGIAYLSIDPINNRTVLILNRIQRWLTFTGVMIMP